MTPIRHNSKVLFSPMLAGSLACLFFAVSAVRGEKPKSPHVGGGMAFANDWMPTHLETKSKLLDGLEFYAREVVGKGKGGPPTTIVGPFTWRMPLADAMKALPAGYDKAPEEKIDWDCFPKDSLLVEGFHVNYFLDRGQAFDWLYLIVDRERRLVGVEFVATNPKRLDWVPNHPVVKKEPYYDFIKMKNNASTTQHVDYQVLHPADTVPMVHTALVKNPPIFKVLEDVHWYLAPPFAHALLNVVAFQRKWAAGGR